MSLAQQTLIIGMRALLASLHYTASYPTLCFEMQHFHTHSLRQPTRISTLQSSHAHIVLPYLYIV